MKGTITEVRPGVWRLRAVVGYRPDGQPKQASRTVRGTRRTAQSELARFVAEADGVNPPGTNLPSVGAFLDDWLEHVRAHRQPDTIRNYVWRCRRFQKEFGTIRIDKLRAQHLDELYRRWLGEGMKPITIRAYHSVLSSALSQAVKWSLVPQSVAKLATLPTGSVKRMTTPDVEVVRRLVTESEEPDPVLSAAIFLAALTGCRRGELLGLRWTDIDRDRSVLHVERSVKRGEQGRQLFVGPTKTHQARAISLDPVMLGVLDARRLQAERVAADAFVTLDNEGFVLTEDPTGTTPMAPDALTHRFSRLVHHLGVGPVRFHDLRHSVATTLLGAGYDLAVVAGRLGHRDPSITLRVYAHALEQRDRQAAAALGALYQPDPPGAVTTGR